MKDILIIEDTRLHQEKIKSLIADMGYNIDGVFACGEKALEYIFKNNKQPDLIIIDIVLKDDMDGYEVAEKITSQTTVPIIFLTGMDDDISIFDLKKFEAYVYLNKPFSKQELKNNIELVLHKYEIYKKLQDSIEEKKILLENIDIFVWYLKEPDTYGVINKAYADFLGVKKDSIEGKSIYRFLNKKEAVRCIESNKEIFSRKEQLKKREWVTDKNGEKKLLSITKTPHLDNEGYVEYIVCSAKDITSEFKLEQKLRQNKNYLQSIINTIPDIIILLDKEGNYLDVWASKPEDLAAPEKELIGENINKFLPEHIADKFKQYCFKAITDGEMKTLEYKLELYKEEKYFEAHLVALDIVGDDNKEILAVIRNITERKQQEERNKYLSFHDQQTGLYNRRYFENELERLNQTRRLPVTVIVGDMDGLKDINDNYGHKIGDKYIKKAGEIFDAVTRIEDVVARIGGDEFAVILPETDSVSAEKFCNRIKNECRKFNKNKRLPKPLKISLGQATKIKNEDDLNKIFDKADKKMYENKGRRRKKLS